MPQLVKIRASGVGYSFEEFTPGVVGIAKAVKDRDGNVVAAVNVALSALRYSKTTDKMAQRQIGQAVDRLSMHAGNT